MPSGSEVLGNGPIGRQKTLGMPRGCEPLHAILTLPCRPMRILTPVIQIAALAMFHPRQYLTLRRTVTLQLVRNDDPRHVLQALQQLAEKLLRRLFVTSALHQNIEDVVVLVDSAPEVMALAINGQKHFIQVPLVPWLRASMLQLIRIVLPKFQTPLADGLMGHLDPTGQQHLFYVAVTQREAIVEPDSMTDDFAGKAEIFVAFGGSGWRHGWLPILGFDGACREASAGVSISRVRKQGQQLDNAKTAIKKLSRI